MKPGATPKETTSESESKSPPIGECASSKRAVKPSKKSNKPAAKTMIAAVTGIPENEKRMEKQPDNRLQQVIVLGICRLKPMSSHRF